MSMTNRWYIHPFPQIYYFCKFVTSSLDNLLIFDRKDVMDVIVYRKMYNILRFKFGNRCLSSYIDPKLHNFTLLRSGLLQYGIPSGLLQYCSLDIDG